MIYQKFSDRQKLTLLWWNHPRFKDRDGIICDGAVRSGKTVAMAVGFIMWSMRTFNNQTFAICGRTIASLRRNVITHLPTWLEGLFTIEERRNENKLTITVGGRTNVYYLFGGHDEASYTLVQGITLAGVLFDEVALMPRSFVEQAMARCSVAGSKFWFNCNPEGPTHWFYQEWVLKARERNILHLHFTMRDNLSLSSAIRKRYERMYSGVFYARYILGLWTKAEGLIYKQFVETPDRYIIDDAPAIISANIGVDFGGGTSAHAFSCVGFTKSMKELVVLDEYRERDALTPDKLCEAFVDFVKRCRSRWLVADVYCDSAEQTLINGLRVAAAKAGLPVNIVNARKKPINDRIRATCILMGSDRFKITRNCRATIEALQAAVWNAKKPTEDVRLDDGSINIDSLDAMEYAFEQEIGALINLGLTI